MGGSDDWLTREREGNGRKREGEKDIQRKEEERVN